MDQLGNINSLSKVDLTREDLKKLYWYSIFIETGKKLMVKDEWVRIKKGLGEYKHLFDNMIVLWSPKREEIIEDQSIEVYYFSSYFFVGFNKPMSNIEFDELSSINGVISVLGRTENKKQHFIIPISHKEMLRMFDLPSRHTRGQDFTKGDHVRILSGALQNYKGRIKKIRGDRAYIEADVLKKFTADIELNVGALELI